MRGKRRVSMTKQFEEKAFQVKRLGALCLRNPLFVNLSFYKFHFLKFHIGQFKICSIQELRSVPSATKDILLIPMEPTRTISSKKDLSLSRVLQWDAKKTVATPADTMEKILGTLSTLNCPTAPTAFIQITVTKCLSTKS